MNKIDSAYIAQLTINPAFGLKIYQAIVKEGLQACLDQDAFIEAVKQVSQVLLRFDDYILSNNLLQIAKSELPIMEKLPWYQYAQLQILTKRVPKYSLVYPDRFLKKVQDLLNVDLFKSQMDAFLIMTFTDILNYLPYFNSSGRIEVRTFTETLLKERQSFSPHVQSKLEELKEKALPRMMVNPQASSTEEEQSPLAQSDGLKLHNPRAVVLVVGDLAMKKHDVQGIAKDYGIQHTQLEFVGYLEAKQFSFRNLLYTLKYAGVILGPVPHKVGDMGEHSSLVQLLKEPGYPHTFVANENGELKLSKQLLKKGFSEIVAHYNSKESR